MTAWNSTSLSARQVDAIDPNGEGLHWENILSTPDLLIESYFLGGSDFQEGDRLYLGQLVAPGSDPLQLETIEMQYVVDVDAVDDANDQQNVLRGTRPSDPITVVIVTGVQGDYNGDGVVNTSDYTIWRDSLGATGTGLAADGNDDEVVDATDYMIWKSNFGNTAAPVSGTIQSNNVPEPSTLVLLSLLTCVGAGSRRFN